MVGTERSPPAGLPAHGQRASRAREETERMEGLRPGRGRGRWRTAMTPPPIESYVQRLHRELRRHFIADPRILDEVRGHLIDAVERAREQDNSLTAEAQAIERFGSPELVAAAFVTDRTRILHRYLLVTASLAG